jgi:uncharacterized protein YigA (DUF484 family)
MVLIRSLRIFLFLILTNCIISYSLFSMKPPDGASTDQMDYSDVLEHQFTETVRISLRAIDSYREQLSFLDQENSIVKDLAQQLEALFGKVGEIACRIHTSSDLPSMLEELDALKSQLEVLAPQITALRESIQVVDYSEDFDESEENAPSPKAMARRHYSRHKKGKH